MDITRAEQISQGKHLLGQKYLHAKPLWLLTLLTLCCCANAQSGRIHRCIGENGEPTFSDQKCATLNATPSATSPAQTLGADLATAYPVAPSITQTCAVSPDDLRERVAAAFASTNAVGFSGLFLWDGFGQGSAMAPLRDLAALIREPLLSIDLESSPSYHERDQYDDPRARDADDPGYELLIRTVGQQDRNIPFESVRHYQLREQLGCWWLLIPW